MMQTAIPKPLSSEKLSPNARAEMMTTRIRRHIEATVKDKAEVFSTT
jgi:hypothetical protein